MAHSKKLFCSVRTFLFLFVSCLMLASIPTVAADEPIKVHIFLHSHMDLGWIYTMEHYYTGSGGQDGGCVRCIFNNVYDSLDRGTSDRKYMIAEVGFFNRWWSEQSEERRRKVHEYVKAGKIEFVSGGWGTNDEATAYYDDIIDQFVIGHRWLKREFDVDPNSGWQIDPFGHSATHAALMAQAGYDGLFFGRIDYQDWDKRREQKALEFNWRPSNPHGESILGRVLHVHYSDTKPMVNDNYWCRSIFCNGNLNGDRQNQVTEWIRNQAKTVRTKNIAMLVGDDFHLWQESEKDFKGIEDMIQYYKNNPQLGIEVKFSSLSVYLKETEDAMIADNSILANLPQKHGDFFPYVENEWTSWSGYFTSKSMWKHRVRQFSEYYNAAKLLFSKYLLKNNQDILKNDKDTQGKIDHALDSLEQALAVVQHHDGVSGTNKENVRQDYDRMLNEGRTAVHDRLKPLLSGYAKTVTGENLQYTEPLRMELRQEDPKIKEAFDNNKKVVMSVFNPGQKDTYLLKLRVPNDRYKVLDENNNYLNPDIICNSEDAQSDCFMYFKDVLPAYSLKSYIISPAKVSKRVVPQDIKTNVKLEFGDEISFQVNSDLSNFDYKICPDIDHHSLGDAFNGGECIEDSFNLDYKYYESEPSHGGTRVASGAYIFNPRVQDKRRLGNIKNGRIFRGHHLTVVQIFRDDIRTDIKLVHHQLEQGLEIESNLGAIRNPGNGLEIVMTVKSKTIMNSGMEYFTDSNGYYMVHRQKDFKEDFESHNNQPIAGNYYPITSAIFINDNMEKNRITVNTDRAQGATCLDNGEIEIMIHRLTCQDDWKGLGETLNEHEDFGGGMLRVTTRHFLSYSAPNNGIPSRQRRIQYQLDRTPQFWLANTQVDEFIKNRPVEKTLDLPEGVKFYARSYNLNEYVIRFHNLDELQTKTVDIYDLSSKACKLFNGLTGRTDLKIQSINELSIFTHKNRSDVHRNRVDPNTKEVTHNDGASFSTIELVPMEIRTFNIVVSA